MDELQIDSFSLCEFPRAPDFNFDDVNPAFGRGFCASLLWRERLAEADFCDTGRLHDQFDALAG